MRIDRDTGSTVKAKRCLPGFKCLTLNLFAILQGNVKHLERRIAFHIQAVQGLREKKNAIHVPSSCNR